MIATEWLAEYICVIGNITHMQLTVAVRYNTTTSGVMKHEASHLSCSYNNNINNNNMIIIIIIHWSVICINTADKTSDFCVRNVYTKGKF